jgi:FHS family L-fucose permease-like MFS transporter
MTPSAAKPQTPESADARKAGAAGLFLFVVLLFFAWGFATVMIDSLIPKLKGLFALNYFEAMLSQFAFFIAYFVVSIPAGLLLSRVGYMRTNLVGLAVMALGCLLFSPAAGAGIYWGFLVALFIMAAGITTIQVAANPLVAILGKPEGSHFRLNLAQALNSLGTVLAPQVGAAVILKSGVVPPDPKTTPAAVLAAYRTTEAQAVQAPFLGIAAGIAVLCVVFWLLRNHRAAPRASTEASRFSLAVLARPRLAFGVLAIFLYVGAEVTIGSLMVNYLMQPKVMSATAHAACEAPGLSLNALLHPCLKTAQDAGRLLSFYWGGAMVGRLVGSLVLFLRAPAARLLSLFALGTIALVSLSSFSSGWTAAYALIAVGLCNSIMFPTVFTLAIDGLGDETPQASSLLCMAIVGGAIVPVVTGAVADQVGLSLALFVPVACYVLIALYGVLAHSQQKLSDAPIAATP